MKKNLNISNEELLKLDYKSTHLLKKFTNENGKIIPQRVTNMSKSIHTKITKAIKYTANITIGDIINDNNIPSLYQYKFG